MKKMTLICLIALALIAGLLPVSAAEQPAASLDENLIIHYDFEGDDIETQLSDKAPAGSSKDDITAYKAEDVSIADGVAHLKGVDGLVAEFDKADANGNAANTDLPSNDSGEFTFYYSFKLYGDGLTMGGFRDFFRVSETGSSHLLRFYSGNCNTANKTKDYFFTSGALAAQVVATLPYEGGDWVHFAITMQYDETAKEWDYMCYLSIDGGHTYLTVMEASCADNAEDYMSTATMISLGNRNVKGATEFDIDDVRVYNKVLTDDDLVAINYPDEVGGGEETTGGNDTDETPGDDETGKTPGDDETDEPKETEDEAQTPSGSETDASGGDDGGCASSLALSASSLLLIVGGAWLAMKTKKN